MNPVKALENHGQAVWLDFLARGFVAKGDLKKLIDSDGVKGVTSNPSIFEKAIGSSDEYDAPIGQTLKKGDRPVAELFEHLAIEDIQHAADVLRPVYDRTQGQDGFVSLEVSPYLALDTKGTIVEAERLWKEVEPQESDGESAGDSARPAGDPAADRRRHQHQHYAVVLAESLCEGRRGLSRRPRKIRRRAAAIPRHVASVASFFVSRIDSAVDKQLDDKIAKANDPTEKKRLAALKGKVAIANAKLAYQEYKRLFSGARWDKLAAKGAKPQRLLWASTGTKNKDYSDVLYVEELIGPNTVNTVPPAHARRLPRPRQRRATAWKKISRTPGTSWPKLEKSGISLDAITAELVKDGVKQFADAADKLYGAVAHKRATVLGEGIDRQALALGNDLGKAVEKSAEDWRASAKSVSLWQHDQVGVDRRRRGQMAGLASSPADGRHRRLRGLFASGEGTAFQRRGRARHGRIEPRSRSAGPDLRQAAGLSEAACAGFDRSGADPHACEAEIDLADTLFIVSSKSGSTTEPNMMKDYFFERVSRGARRRQGRPALHRRDRSRLGAAEGRGAGRVSPTSSMATPPSADAIRCCRHSAWCPRRPPASICARCSAHTQAMVRSCGPDVPPAENPGVQLGLALGLAGLRAAATRSPSIASPKIADFGAWAEQLIAESTGKHGKGLIPIDGETLGDAGLYGNDRFFIDIRTEGETDAAHDATLAALEKAGHPVVRIVMKSIDHIGQEFFRFEIATAVAGSVLGINPFNQPDVEAAKIKTRELTAAYEKSGSLPGKNRWFRPRPADLYHRRQATPAALRKAGANGDLRSWLKAHLAEIRQRRLCRDARLYRAQRGAYRARCSTSRLAVRDQRHVATCAEFGPRFLHSTGQAYKGGPDSGVFLQITADDAARSGRARPEGELWRHQGSPGPRRFRRADRTRPARAACAPQGRSGIGIEDARRRDRGSAELMTRITSSHIQEFKDATRHDRAWPDGRQYRPPADEAGTHHRRL